MATRLYKRVLALIDQGLDGQTATSQHSTPWDSLDSPQDGRGTVDLELVKLAFDGASDCNSTLVFIPDDVLAIFSNLPPDSPHDAEVSDTETCLSIPMMEMARGCAPEQARFCHGILGLVFLKKPKFFVPLLGLCIAATVSDVWFAM